MPPALFVSLVLLVAAAKREKRSQNAMDAVALVAGT